MNDYNDNKNWLPTTAKEVKDRGWDQLDVILFSGDAYIDHPSFGIPVIGRILENAGLRVAIIPQPNWQDDLRDFKKLGPPTLFFGVSAGAMDSMVNHYTANKKIRSNDAYTPGDKHGFRPDYPTIVYTRILKSLYPDIPVIIGGIEASLRRYTHFDYWQDRLRPSILFESGADLLVYGMGEKPIEEIAMLMQKGVPLENLKSIHQVSYISDTDDIAINQNWHNQLLFSHEECMKDKVKFAKNFKLIETESNKQTAKRLIQPIENKFIVVNPPHAIPTVGEMDKYHDLPYTRMPHPKYRFKAPIPAYEMIRHSINTHRGCFGGCSFCTISAHQGKFVSSRSETSVMKEVESIKNMPDFKGHITDIGGPSANMYKMEGKDLSICKRCSRASCIFPSKCTNLNDDHQPMNDLYKSVRNTNGINKVTIGSGIRYDLFIDGLENKTNNNKKEYFENLLKYHVSGRLKVAPEHSEDKVLKIMRKPRFEMFSFFKQKFDETNRRHNLNLQLIPYFISSHPESKIEDMANLAIRTKNHGYRLEQIQDFTPTPMTLATVMFYTGIDPYTLKPVYVPRHSKQKNDQRLLFFWYRKENREAIKNALRKINRTDLIHKLFGKKISC